MDTDFCIDALEEALQRHGTPEIFNTDQGAQFAYSRPRLPLIPDEACHPFHAKAATDSTAKLPPWQAA